MVLELSSMPLAIFTTLAPAGLMAFVFMSIIRMCERDPLRQERADLLIGIPFFLVLSGFIVSTVHLGTPANALFVITGVGRSPLSNEVISTLAFLFLSGSYWMSSLSRRLKPTVSRAWLCAASCSSIAALTFISRAYSIETIPTWNTVFTQVSLAAGAVGLGALISEFTRLSVHGPKKAGSVMFLSIYLVSCAVVAVAMLLYRGEIEGIASFGVSAVDLVPRYGLYMAGYAVSEIIAFIVGLTVSFRDGTSARVRPVLTVMSTASALWGVFLIRSMFYQLYMTTGI